MQTVGFIGLGKMGTSIATNIQRAGYPMTVHDAREEAAKPLLEGGARLAGSPAEVARDCEVVLTSLPGPREVTEVVTGRDGILDGIQAGHVYLDLSTCGPELLREAAPVFHQKGAQLMDTPVLSLPSWAANRSLIVMAGGERGVFDRVRPLLDAFADKVVYTGGLGTATVCKLVSNMMEFAMGQVMAEGLTLGVKAGVELDVLMDTGSRGPLGMRQGIMSETVFQGRYTPPRFTLALAIKDIALATQLAREVGVPMPMINLSEQILRQAANRDWAEEDYTRPFALQEEAAGVELRSGGESESAQDRS